jgi:photosystem II stability/assembly factor-like uncharacterized protein
MSAIALDPLIAEAKRRARRRRLLAASAIAAGVGVAIWATLPRSSPEVAGGNGSQAPALLASRVAIDGFGVKSSERWFVSAVSSSGLWISTNAGRTWRLARAPGIRGSYPLSRYAGDDFIDPTHGWVVLDGSGDRRIQIDRTTDGGRTWRVSHVPAWLPGTFPSVHFRTRLNGYLEITDGRRAERFVTTDGGASWALKSGGPRLLRHRHGFQVFIPNKPGAPVGTLMQTNDHGRHWSRVPLPDDRNMSFVSSFGRVVVAVGQFGQLGAYVSEDGGDTWTLRLAPRQINPGVPQFNVSVPAPGAWYALSAGNVGQTTPTTLWATHDEGRTWHVVPISGVHPAWGTQPIHFVTARLGWALGGPRGRALLRTTDGGRHWTQAGPLKPKAQPHG